MRQTNLWNIGDKKTRKVLEYIRKLVPNEVEFDDKKFRKIKEEALIMASPNEALKHIGYNIDKEDDIYEWCNTKKDEVR